MDPLWLLVIGVLVVFGGIMAARLPAFLALVLGALVVGALTPTASLQRYAQDKKMSEAATEDLGLLWILKQAEIGYGKRPTR